MKRAAGFIYNYIPVYIDHLAPLCHILGIPLIVSDPLLLEYRDFYPETEFVYIPPIEVKSYLFENFDTLFNCLPKPFLEALFLFDEMWREKKFKIVWLPHGNSDKGKAFKAVDALKDETHVLFYGKQMVDEYFNFCASPSLQSYVVTGNYRYHFFQKYLTHFQSLVKTHLPKLDPSLKTILYAPTWNDAETSCSIPSAASTVIRNLPSHYNLIIKPHPNTEIKDLLLLEKEALSSPHGQHISIIENFPPIFPLLEVADYYLGDMSSVGYDFLKFDRPLFFINHHKRDVSNDRGLLLHQCGTSLFVEDLHQFYALLEQEDAYAEKRKALYKEAFEEKSLTELKEEITANFFDCKAGLLG